MKSPVSDGGANFVQGQTTQFGRTPDSNPTPTQQLLDDSPRLELAPPERSERGFFFVAWSYVPRRPWIMASDP
jgi:hypothetical protein